MVVAYGMILPQPILDAPPLGCFNLHASLLPRWRGAAPINRAIMAGDAETGVMVMKMDEGLDTGDVAMAERIAITDAMTVERSARCAGAARRRPDGAGARRRWSAAGCNSPRSPRTASPTRPRSTRPRRGSTSRSRRSAVLRHIHGLSPFPGAWCELPIEGEAVRVKVLRCALAEGAARRARCSTTVSPSPAATARSASLQLQRAGKQPMQAEEFLRGTPIAAGVRVS